MKKATRSEEQSRPCKANNTTKHGLMIQRKSERVPNNWGEPHTATRYSLPESQRQAANIAMLALTNKQSKGAYDDN